MWKVGDSYAAKKRDSPSHRLRRKGPSEGEAVQLEETTGVETSEGGREIECGKVGDRRQRVEWLNIFEESIYS